MGKISILLADDHPLVRSGLVKLLEPYNDFTVVGEAGDGEEAVAKTIKLRPDVVVLDLSMPKVNGVEATKRIKEKVPTTKVLILTMYDNEEYIYQIFQSGASGYVLKNSTKDQLAQAIRSVARGEKYFSPEVSEIMVQAYLQRIKHHEQPVHGTTTLPLTKREKEILLLIGEGLNNVQIAEKLFISPRTVDTHRTNIMQKLNIHDASNLVRFAILNRDKLTS
ncbi:MAG: response regulator transcription factor [Bacteroidetes bacterium]|nr:response regulator transcription factor [Bacteroidota bacterium]